MSTANVIAPSEPWSSLMPSTWSGLRGVVFAAACTAGLLAILLLEVLSASYTSVGALAVIPVAASAWLLPGKGATAILGFALIVRGLGVALGGIDPLTAGVEAVVLVVVGVAIRQAGGLLLRWRDSEVRLRAQGEHLAVLAERERIGSQAYENAIHALIGATLQLQSAATMIEQVAARERVAATIDELDRVIIQLRQAILKPDPDTSDPTPP